MTDAEFLKRVKQFEHMRKPDGLMSLPTVDFLRLYSLAASWVNRRPISADACNCTADQYGYARNPNCAVHS